MASGITTGDVAANGIMASTEGAGSAKSRHRALTVFLSAEARAAGLRWQSPRPLDAGFDLPALDDVTIPVGGVSLVRTGIHLAIPEGWVGLIRDRSSVAMRGGATLAGVIDASYRGEVKVAFINHGAEPLQFSRGDRVAQIIIVPHLGGDECEVVKDFDALGETARGSGGFGSTGK